MTCIAYKDGVLATDRQVTHNGLIESTDDKLFVIGDSIAIAYSGLMGVSYMFREWYEEGHKREDWPLSTEIPVRGCNFVVLVMHTHKKKVTSLEYWDDIIIPMPLDPKIYHAYGSGREIALGAMYAGSSTMQAVEATNYHLDDCGFGVSYVDMKSTLHNNPKIQRTIS